MNIRKKLTLVFLLIGLLPVIIFGLFSLDNQSRIIENYALEEALSQADIIGASLLTEPPVSQPLALFRRPKELQRFVEKFHSQAGRDFVVIDDKAIVIADSVKENIGTVFPHFENDKKNIESLIRQTLSTGIVNSFKEISSDGTFHQIIVAIKDRSPVGGNKIMGGLILDRTDLLEEAGEFAVTAASSIANAMGVALIEIKTENGQPMFKNSIALQNYILDQHDLNNRDIVIVDKNKKILADTIKLNIGATFQYDLNDEVGQTIEDGKTRVFIKKSNDFPFEIHQITLPIRQRGSQNIFGAIIYEFEAIFEGRSKRIYKDSVATAEILALTISTIPSAIAPEPIFNDSAKLQKFLLDFHDRYQRDFVVLNKDLRIIADAVPENIGSKFPHFEYDKKNIENLLKLTIAEQKIGQFREVSEDGNFELISIPLVRENSETAGTLLFEYSAIYDTALESINNLKLLWAIIILLIAGIVGFFSLYLARVITTPLLALSQKALAIGEGDFSQTVEVHSDDEIGMLGNAFNKMGDLLKKNDQQQKLLAQLEQKNTELERFAYTVSHDLKSPLVTVNGFIGLLERDIANGDNSRVKADIQKIMSATQTMAALLEDLLELSRIGRQVHPSHEFSLNELSESIIETLQSLIEESKAEIKIQPAMPLVFADQLRIGEVIQNLLENAIKFSGEDNHPRIEISATRKQNKVVVSFKDNGIGIEPRYHDNVFGLFNRLDSNVPGTGVGLALVKRIVEIHGGQIWIESSGDRQGTTFCFTLPMVDLKDGSS